MIFPKRLFQQREELFYIAPIPNLYSKIAAFSCESEKAAIK